MLKRKFGSFFTHKVVLCVSITMAGITQFRQNVDLGPSHFQVFNCAMKIKSHFEDVDQLIAKVKAVTIKNKTRQAKFSAIGYPPQPVPARWGSWLNTALYYAKLCPK